MKPIKFNLVALGLLGVLLCLPASAENEATYTPDGMLNIPYLQVVNDAGQAVSRYAATLQKISSSWTFGIAGLTDLDIPAAPVANEATYTSSGTLYIPHARLLNSQGQTLRNYAVFMRRVSPGWNFKIVGLTDLDAPEEDSSTNTTTNVTSDVAGNWDFTFAPYYDKTFTGTEFGRTTNAAPPPSLTLSLTLEQSDEDVTGTGTADSVQYTLSGQVSGDLFSFSMLAGYTNLDMGLLSAHVTVAEDGSMGGDYYATKTNGVTTIEFGAATATKP